MRQAESFFARVANWYEQNPWVVYAAIAVFFILIIIQIFSSITGTAGLGRGVVHVEAGVETLGFGELFSESLQYFWRLFGVAAIIWLPYVVFLALLIFGSILYMAAGNFNEMASMSEVALMLISLCCCASPVAIALSLYHFQVKRAVMVEEMGITESLMRGWQVLSKNIIPLLIIGVLLFIATFIIGILIALPIFFLVFPLFISFAQGNISSWQPFIWVTVAVLCYSPIAWLFNGILTTYTESVWTLSYMRLVQSKDEPEENTPILETDSNA